MEIKINYHAELEAKVVEQINFIREEFDVLFNHKIHYSARDREVATGLINYLANIVESEFALQALSKTLEELEIKYPNLF